MAERSESSDCWPMAAPFTVMALLGIARAAATTRAASTTRKARNRFMRGACYRLVPQLPNRR